MFLILLLLLSSAALRRAEVLVEIEQLALNQIFASLGCPVLLSYRKQQSKTHKISHNTYINKDNGVCFSGSLRPFLS